MIAIAGVIVIVLAYFLQRAWPNGWPLEKKQNAQSNAAITEIHSGGVRINEVMSSNKSALTAQDGTAPDWIEIMNASGSAQNLAGYSLAKRANAANVFTFPDITLQPEECVIVFADSRLRDTAGEELHAPFGISAAGDTLLLFNPSGTAIDTVNLPALRGDEAYARVKRIDRGEERTLLPVDDDFAAVRLQNAAEIEHQHNHPYAFWLRLLLSSTAWSHTIGF